MATKTGILATINGFLTAIITQAKVRSASSTIVDEIYPAIVLDSNTTETYTTKAGTDITYSIEIIKSGNIAHVKGSIVNTTGGILPFLSNIFTWKDTEYRMITGQQIRFTANGSFGSSVIMTLSRDLGLIASDPLPVGTFDFSFQTYITQA